jgi:hypothetical protein
LQNEEKARALTEALKTVKSRLGEGGANERAATVVIDFLLKKSS